MPLKPYKLAPTSILLLSWAPLSFRTLRKLDILLPKFLVADEIYELLIPPYELTTNYPNYLTFEPLLLRTTHIY
jgi:hypothetical protein